MLRIALSVRFSLVLGFGLLSSCASHHPVVHPSGGGGAQTQTSSTITASKKCIELQTSKDEFVAEHPQGDCDPNKDNAAIGVQPQPTGEVESKSIATPRLEPVWLLIDTKKMQIEVKRGEKTLTTFSNIAIGRSGSGVKNHRGDDITPLGEYKIGWVNDKSPFRIFYGLTYPSVQDAEQAFKKGFISEQDYQAILDAHQHNRIPPQNTPLGGQVGVHGLGKGDEKIHRLMNWTHGCVAVTNEQLEELGDWIEEGTVVKIK
jgi:hypothetical protein